jgi:hypothetical protein
MNARMTTVETIDLEQLKAEQIPGHYRIEAAEQGTTERVKPTDAYIYFRVLVLGIQTNSD